MTNELLNEEVARVTGEDLSTIEHLGFTQAGSVPTSSSLKLPYGTEISEHISSQKHFLKNKNSA